MPIVFAVGLDTTLATDLLDDPIIFSPMIALVLTSTNELKISESNTGALVSRDS